MEVPECFVVNLFFIYFIYLFLIPHLDHGNIIYEQAYIFAFHQKLELFQYNVP